VAAVSENFGGGFWVPPPWQEVGVLGVGTPTSNFESQKHDRKNNDMKQNAILIALLLATAPVWAKTVSTS